MNGAAATHTACILSVHVCAPTGLHLQNTGPKRKVCQQQSIKPNGDPFEHRPLCSYTGGESMKPARPPHNRTTGACHYHSLMKLKHTHTHIKQSTQGPSAYGPAGIPVLLCQTRLPVWPVWCLGTTTGQEVGHQGFDPFLSNCASLTSLPYDSGFHLTCACNSCLFFHTSYSFYKPELVAWSLFSSY